MSPTQRSKSSGGQPDSWTSSRYTPIRDVHRAVPDISFAIEDYAGQGDKIWVRVRARGTATGPFFGPPSNKPVDVTVFDLARVVDGRIVEHWGVPDRFAMLAQTGLLDRLAR